jgi:uncharacterized LabA/DUF88 family protein
VKFAGLFIDYENLFYFLRRRLKEDQDPGDAVIRMIRSIRIRLQQEKEEQCIVQHAYADFDKIEEDAQTALYLTGVESHHVSGTDHKNAADMQLCIDAMATMYSRPEIQSFVFMAGDRDYIPVIRHLRTHAKLVRVSSFIGNVSGDLLQVAGEENFIDAAMLLPSGFDLLPHDREAQPKKILPATIAPAAPAPVRPPQPPKFTPSQSLDSEECLAVGCMLRHFGDKTEVWMTPFLHRLREEMPLLAEYERKSLVTDLSEKGAIAVEKRPGSPKDFSVIIINWQHPDVRRLNP